MSAAADDYGWAECPTCHKVRQLVRRKGDTDEMFALWVKLAERSLCTACSMDVHVKQNTCPDAVSDDHGVSGCKLGWHHEGRCEPEFTLAELQAAFDNGTPVKVVHNPDGGAHRVRVGAVVGRGRPFGTVARKDQHCFSVHAPPTPRRSHVGGLVHPQQPLPLPTDEATSELEDPAR